MLRNCVRSIFAVLVLMTNANASNSPTDRAKQVACITRNIYEEARSESVQSQILVGLITRKRAYEDGRHGDYCGAVYQKHQFSWTAKKAELNENKVDTVAWTLANFIAQGIYDGRYELDGDMRCAGWYKRTDGKGVSENSKRFFDTRLFPIRSFDAHTAYGLESCVREARL